METCTIAEAADPRGAPATRRVSRCAAFQRFVKAQRQLLDILRTAAERDQKLLETLSQAK
jgi:hypothetical protein